MKMYGEWTLQLPLFHLQEYCDLLNIWCPAKKRIMSFLPTAIHHQVLEKNFRLPLPNLLTWRIFTSNLNSFYILEATKFWVHSKQHFQFWRWKQPLQAKILYLQWKRWKNGAAGKKFTIFIVKTEVQ